MRTRPALFGAGRWALLVLVALLLGTAAAFPRDVLVSGDQDTLDYGSRHRGEIIRDTLRVFARGEDGTKVLLRATDTEITCDCITAAVVDSGPRAGQVAFDFHVEPAEPTGRIEKVLYVFADNQTPDLVRFLLTVNVLPGGEVDTTGAAGVTGGGVEAGPAPDSTAHALGTRPLDVLFFYSPRCQACRRVRDYTLPYLRTTWGGAIRIDEVNIDTRAGLSRLLAVRNHYRISDRSSPFAFAVGDTMLTGENDLAKRLDTAIDRSVHEGAVTFAASDLHPREARHSVRSVFRSFSFWTVVGAGLLDGINPCAFATLVFFIGLLGYMGSSRRQMLVVGTGFTITVFVVYLLLGLGAFRALQALAVYSVVARIIYGATILLLVVLFALSVRDTVRYWRTGQTGDQALQLSTKTKQRIHKVMRRGLKTPNVLLGAIGIGAVVTLFEAACTGQVYLPTIVLVLQDPAMRAHAILYLVLYNLLFTAPLVVVFGLAYAGVANDRFAEWSKRHYGLTRVALSLLFGALAVVMLLQWMHL